MPVLKPTSGEIVDEDDINPPVSKPFRQALAGPADMVSSSISMLGLGGAGLEALANQIVDDFDLPLKRGGTVEDFTAPFVRLKDNFLEAISSGVDRSLLETGLELREGTNRFYGIPEPQSTVDQAARLLTSMLPVPGIPRIPGKSLTSLTANLLANTANIALPAIRYNKTSTSPFRDALVGKVIDGTVLNKGNAAKIAAQYTFAGGVDQGIRAVMDDPEFPLMFADLETPSLVSSAEAGEIIDEDNLIIDEDDLIVEQEEDFIIEEDQTKVEVSAHLQRVRDLDEKVQRQDDWDTVKEWSMIAGTFALVLGGAKYSKRLIQNRAIANAPYGPPGTPPNKIIEFAEDIDPTDLFTRPGAYMRSLPGVLRQGFDDSTSYVGEAFVDRSKAMANALVAQGAPRHVIDRIISNSHTDPVGMSGRVIETGQFGQGFVGGVLGNGKTHALVDLENTYQALPAPFRKLFDEGMLANTIRASRGGGDPPSVLWGRSKSNDDLTALVDAAQSNTRVGRLMNQMSETFSDHLDYQVHRGIITDAERIAFKSKFSGPGNTLSYMPLYTANPGDFFRALAKTFGLHTKKGQQLDIAGFYHARGPDGVTNPINPMQALRQYTVHSIDNTNTAAYHAQALQTLSGVRFIGGKAVPFARDAQGNIVAPTRNNPQRTGRETTYLGRGEIGEDVDAVQIAVNKDAPKGFSNGSINDIRQQARNPDEIFAVQHQGKLEIFHVPDAGIRAALNLNPQLGTALQIANHFKSLFTSMTTGKLSVFAPVSFAFSSQQVALATAGRAAGGPLKAIYAAGKTVPQSIGGARELLVASWANDVSQYLAKRIAKHSGIDDRAPHSIIKLQRVLENRFRNSLINDVRGETGRIASSLQAPTFTGTAQDFANATGPSFVKMYGKDEMGLVWNMWKSWNTALHEGPAFGAMQMSIGNARLAGKKVTEQTIRNAVDHSKTVAGDMRRVGASKAAEIFNASVPFSAAMIQSWNALGSAAWHGKTFADKMKSFTNFTAGAGALIGVPTMMELMHTASLGNAKNADGTPVTFADASGKEWTYNDYYWNGYTSQQRAANMIIMLPGEPPWEAILMPISPEWGLFRGAVMEGADAMFNLSDVGAIAGADKGSGKIGRRQWHESLMRVLDIPVPPLLAAGASYLDADIQLGFAVKESNDPNDPGAGASFIRINSLGQGERVTRRSGKEKFIGDDLDIRTVAMIQDLFGSGGALYVGMHNAFVSGKKLNNGSILAGADKALEALGDGLRKQARWTQPLWGQTLRPSAGGEIASSLFSRRNALTALTKDASLLKNLGLGTPGNTDLPPDDPINMELAASASTALTEVGRLDSQISVLRKDISSMGNATMYNEEPVSIQERNKIMDGMNLEIQALKAQQLAFIINYEDLASDILSERYDREVNIDLSTFKPRSDLPASSISQELQSPPQTSQ